MNILEQPRTLWRAWAKSASPQFDFSRGLAIKFLSGRAPIFLEERKSIMLGNKNLTYFLNSCETDYIKVKAESSMRFPYRNTTKDAGSALLWYSNNLIYISFRLQLVCNVNLSAIIFVFSNGSKLSDQVFNISVRLECNFCSRFVLQTMKLDYVSWNNTELSFLKPIFSSFF